MESVRQNNKVTVIVDKTLDKNIKHALLKPLSRRRTPVSDRKIILDALELIDERGVGNAILPGILKIVKDRRSDHKSERPKDQNQTIKQIVLTQALYLSRRFSRAQYVFSASVLVEDINESRLINGEFDEELRGIIQKLDGLDKEYGLNPGEYWPRGQGPDEYERLHYPLTKQYEVVIDIHFQMALREFGLTDLADLRNQNPHEFKRLRERGRRSFFHKEEIVLAIKDIVIRYEEDAARAASAKAFYAAITLLGAGLEGLLLFRCLRSKRKALKVASELPSTKRPKPTDDPLKWTFEALLNTCNAAGWLPRVSTEYAEYAPDALARILKEMRNFVHPGRHARDNPWSEADEREYKDAKAIYIMLRSRLLSSRNTKHTEKISVR